MPKLEDLRHQLRRAPAHKPPWLDTLNEPSWDALFMELRRRCADAPPSTITVTVAVPYYFMQVVMRHMPTDVNPVPGWRSQRNDDPVKHEAVFTLWRESHGPG